MSGVAAIVRAWAKSAWLNLPILLAILGLIAAFLQLQGQQEKYQSWLILANRAEGNSGKILALEYLNRDNAPSIPNPYGLTVFGWRIPFGRKPQPGDALPPDWVRIEFGGWKVRDSLYGIDLSSPSEPAAGSAPFCRHATFLEPINLDNADLEFANLHCANLNYANFRGADLADVDFGYAALMFADFSDARMSSVDLSHAALLRANFSGAQANGVSFVNADVPQVDFRGAYLFAADFSGASLDQARLEGADLRHAKLATANRVTQDQINGACVDESTTLPTGIHSPPRCETVRSTTRLAYHINMYKLDEIVTCSRYVVKRVGQPCAHP